MNALPERFTSKFMPEPMTGCWLWTANCNQNGYGRYGLGAAKHVPAHRFSYEHTFGKVPAGLELDHVCKVRCCVNPHHLRAVTHAENMKTAVFGDRKKLTCSHGHDLSVTRVLVGGKKSRCYECHKVNEKNRYMRRVSK